MSWFIVTVKGDKDPDHNPHAKKSDECEVSTLCTDSTGEHHSYLEHAESLAEMLTSARASFSHVTRVEQVPDGMIEEILEDQGPSSFSPIVYCKVSDFPQVALIKRPPKGTPWISWPDRAEVNLLATDLTEREIRVSLALIEQAKINLEHALELRTAQRWSTEGGR